MNWRLAAFIVGLIGSLLSGEETPLPTRSSTPSEMKAARDRIDAYYRSLPPEAQPVVYVVVAGKLVPAQIDPVHNIEYRWRGMVLGSSQVPRLEQSGSFGVFPIKPTGMEVREIAPPIRYYALPGTKRFAAGYFDPSNAILYQWDCVELSRASLPSDAEAQGLIIEPTSVEISSIDPPPEFAAKEDAAAEQRPDPSTPAPTTQPAASPQPATPVAQTPAAIVERKLPVWPWLVGIVALVVIVAVALKRRT